MPEAVSRRSVRIHPGRIRNDNLEFRSRFELRHLRSSLKEEHPHHADVGRRVMTKYFPLPFRDSAGAVLIGVHGRMRSPLATRIH